MTEDVALKMPEGFVDPIPAETTQCSSMVSATRHATSTTAREQGGT